MGRLKEFILSIYHLQQIKATLYMLSKCQHGDKKMSHIMSLFKLKTC